MRERSNSSYPNEQQAPLRAWEETLFRSPDNNAVAIQLAAGYWKLQQYQSAIDTLAAGLRFPANAVLLRAQLGDYLRQLGMWSDAESIYRSLVELEPQSIDWKIRLATSLHRQGRVQEAAQLYHRILQLNPSHALTWNDLAIAFQQLNRYSESLSAYTEAIKLDSDYIDAYFNRASCFVQANAIEPAIDDLRRVLAKQPDNSKALSLQVSLQQSVCDWSQIDVHCHELIRMVEADNEMHGISPFTFIGLAVPTSLEQQRRCASNWGKQFTHCERPLWTQRETRDSVEKRLRIGYLSADFREHAVGHLLPEWFRSHDRTQFEIFGYSLTGKEDSATAHAIEQAVDVMRYLPVTSHRDIANQIAMDTIDILVDLQGYTSHSRPEILSLRPAPIAVHYLGFPGTMGVDFIDYLIADDYVVLPKQEANYAEKIVHLPGCYQVNSQYATIAERTPTRAEHNLPAEAVVFCSFNNPYKFTPAMWDVWMQLLSRVEHSVLWLAINSMVARKNLLEEAVKRNIAESRIVFAPIVPLAEHLRRQSLADVFLDSSPYNGHATSSIALRMHVPIVTLAGQTLASRVTGSMLTTIGVDSLIGKDLAEYESIAFRLATNQNERLSLREQIASGIETSAIFDGFDFARRTEAAYRIMMERFRRGEPPGRIESNAIRKAMQR